MKLQQTIKCKWTPNNKTKKVASIKYFDTFTLITNKFDKF